MTKTVTPMKHFSMWAVINYIHTNIYLFNIYVMFCNYYLNNFVLLQAFCPIIHFRFMQKYLQNKNKLIKNWHNLCLRSIGTYVSSYNNYLCHCPLLTNGYICHQCLASKIRTIVASYIVFLHTNKLLKSKTGSQCCFWKQAQECSY